MRPILLALTALVLCAPFPTALAAWEGEDPRGDATHPAANAWGDLVRGTIDGESVRIEVASRSAPAFGTAFVALYEVDGETRFCAAMEDRSLLGYTGTWDAEGRAPSDARPADAKLGADGAGYEIAGCVDATNASTASFLAVDAKPTPIGLAGLVLDEMPASAADLDARMATEELAPAAATSEAPPTGGEPTGDDARPVPLAGPGLALVALAAAARRRLRARGRA